MASISILDKGTPDERYKVIYDVVPDRLSKRKRRSRTFPQGTTLKEVKRFVREVEEQKDKGIYIDTSKKILDEFAGEYFEMYGDFISPTTLENYQQMYYSKANGIKKYLGHMKLEKIETADIQAYIKILIDDGKSPKTIKNRIMFLHTLMGKAMKLNFIKRGFNPAEGCEMPKVKPKRVEVYTADEIRQLLTAVNLQGNMNEKLIINILVGSGIRKSELCSLKFDSFDFKEGTVTIDSSRVLALGHTYVKETKTTSSMRIIPLPKSIFQLVKLADIEYKTRKIKYGTKFVDSGYILTNQMGEPLSPDGVYNIYRRFLKKQPELRYLPMHKLRHTFASLAIANNTDIKTVQELLGHSSAIFTLNVYSHAYSQKKKEHAQMLDDMLYKNRNQA